MPKAAFLLLLATLATASATASPATEDAWIRATPPGAPTAAAYAAIAGTGTADRLVAVRTDAAERVEIHASATHDGLATMTRLEELPIPAAGKTTLAPGGEHLMLIGLRQALAPGDKVAFTLVFAQAGEVPVTFEVRDARAPATSSAAPPTAAEHAHH